MNLEEEPVQELVKQDFNGTGLYIRPGMESDLQAADEVLLQRGYFKYFDVEKGEAWLDLGANIGAYTAYCVQRGAIVTAFEPDAGCFEVLEANSQSSLSILVHAAVTASSDVFLSFSKSANPLNQYRGTVEVPPAVYVKTGNFVRNVSAAALHGSYDGIKMDIEGSEAEIILQGMLPKCDKLAMEYHRGRGHGLDSEEEIRRKLAGLFRRVVWEENEQHPSWDPIVYAWGPK